MGRSQQEMISISFGSDYAVMELLAGTDNHTLAKQLGNFAQIIEQYYSKLTATLAAERLA